jgi:hypothetical protein
VNGNWVEARSGKRFDVLGIIVYVIVFLTTTNLFQTREVVKYGHQLQTITQKMLMQLSPLLMRLSRAIGRPHQSRELNYYSGGMHLFVRIEKTLPISSRTKLENHLLNHKAK